MNRYVWLIVGVAATVAMAVGGCSSSPASKAEAAAGRRGARYFESPQQAVPQIDAMLRQAQWEQLAAFYDLTRATVDRSELTSGRFFEATERPPAAHPAGFWRYRHPFAPGFKFDRVEPTQDPQVSKVIMTVAIDQGDGRVQRGFSEFLMRRSERGWQILPPGR